ncbi:MAG: ABC transporter permease [Acidimicrobiaceae bacterium]|nr:ABC transporter permease [Acidimicrobiaceae bacterium]
MDLIDNTLLSEVFMVTWLAGSIRLAAPVLMAALGETIGEVSGVLNVGVEGTMLAGALAAFISANETGSPVLGLAVAGGVGLAVSLFLAWMYVTVRASQVVVGVVFNAAALAAASYTFRAIYGNSPGVMTVSGFRPIEIPLLHRIPILGGSVFTQSPLTYITFALVFGVWVMLYRTRLGLALQAVGDHPKMADAAGLSVAKLRYLGVLASGAFSGCAGGFLMLTAANAYRDNMISGKGFIALAIVIFGAWNPARALWAALIFGAADAMQLSLQAAGYTFVPQLMFALPYLLTIIAVSGLFKRRTQPSALLLPYRRS